MGGDSDSASAEEVLIDSENEQTRATSRRGVLRALGGASALAATPTLARAGAGSDAAQADRTTIVLGARRDYWLGLQPRAIEGQRNPALQLRQGDRYRIVWVNLDGERHRFRLLDADGNAVSQTRAADRQGATRATRFRAGRALAGYDCQFHPEEMRGAVELGEGFPTTAAQTTEETTTEETTATDETTTGAGETTTETGGGSGDVAVVDVGPSGQYFRFVPERAEIPVGGTVRWEFQSAGHNVSCRPEAARQVSLPEGAEPFSSYPEGESFRVVAEGESYEHTFETPGEYTYVCVPHVGEGMIGTVVVTE
ncbi:plastocyanin/azurin family copper-binding protein [Halorussus ruber]|uniref:plastocyanin/azurin family copper-binding protein n=1 Tax=Halorussus ruber TaxID=1126238 RepID=UPI001FE2F1F6|nr:plastocyanin/azurin family copper-binding protein [Halorussus ruber]